MGGEPFENAGLRVSFRLVLGLLLFATSARPDSAEAPPGSDGYTGRQIYERVVENRFRSFTQRAKLISVDRAGRRQESRFEMRWKDFRDEGGNPSEGILSKTLVKYTHPFDLRYSGYLIQANQQRGNDQFVYYPSRRRVVRVNLRNESVYGTDFSFEDVVPREAEDFAYRRLSDTSYEEVPVYTIELFPQELADSEYSKIEVFVEQQRFVIVRARYWDEAGVEVKRFTSDPVHIQEFDGVYVPMRSQMRNLLAESRTELIVTEVDANPRFGKDTFDLSRLEGH